MVSDSPKSHATVTPILFSLLVVCFSFFLFDPVSSLSAVDDSLTYLWPLPSEFTSGNETLSIDPALDLSVGGNGGNSNIVRAAFDRYRGIIFKHGDGVYLFGRLRGRRPVYDISKLRIVVNSASEDVSWV